MCLLKLQEAPLLNQRAPKPPQLNPNMLKPDLFQIPLFGVRAKFGSRQSIISLKLIILLCFPPSGSAPGRPLTPLNGMLTFSFCVVSLGGQNQTLRSFAPTVKVDSEESSWSQSILSFEVVVKVVVGGRTLCWIR